MPIKNYAIPIQIEVEKLALFGQNEDEQLKNLTALITLSLPQLIDFYATIRFINDAPAPANNGRAKGRQSSDTEN